MRTADTGKSREKKIASVTLAGTFVNLFLAAGKFAAGIFGRSSAMLADAVHSMSDLMSDLVVLVFVRISSRKQDKNHDYGHGKFETLAAVLVSLILLAVAVQLLASAIGTIKEILAGTEIPAPGYIALIAALVSVLSKEWLFHYTRKAGEETGSPVVIANAWHHRSDALSSIGSLVGIGGAMLLGDKWIMLDPLASCGISISIMFVAVKMCLPSLKDLMDCSLPDEQEGEIVATAASVPGVRGVSHLKTRMSGPDIIMEAHILVQGELTVREGHDITVKVENALKERFGENMQISLHVEPSEE